MVFSPTHDAASPRDSGGARRRGPAGGIRRLVDTENPQRSTLAAPAAPIDLAPPSAPTQLRRLRNEVFLAVALKLAALFVLYLLFFTPSRMPTFDALDAPRGQSSRGG
jgi:hypothetical protein